MPGWEGYASLNCYAHLIFGAGHDLYVVLSSQYVYCNAHSFKNNYNYGISIGSGQPLLDVEVYSVNSAWFN